MSLFTNEDFKKDIEMLFKLLLICARIGQGMILFSTCPKAVYLEVLQIFKSHTRQLSSKYEACEQTHNLSRNRILPPFLCILTTPQGPKVRWSWNCTVPKVGRSPTRPSWEWRARSVVVGASSRSCQGNGGPGRQLHEWVERFTRQWKDAKFTSKSISV